MLQVMQNRMAELSFQSSAAYSDPFNEVSLTAVFTDENGRETTVPGFWAGEGVWKIRFASPNTGVYSYRTSCSDASNAGLHGQTGQIQIIPYEGDNPLYKHGPLRQSKNRKYLEHLDGSPFLWLGDTWWMALTKRLKWPEDFQEMIRDRVAKGFSVIQIVAGLYPDMDPFDERGANNAGFPWDRNFQSINPDYFNEADHKLIALAEAGLVPCIVGCWGFFLEFAGEEVIRKHWDYLLARYGALPAVWCMAGEATMPFYTHPAFGNPEKTKEYNAKLRRGWTEMTRYVKSRDPFARPVTIHPTQYGREMVEDAELLDLEMLQTGHSSFYSIANTVKMVQESVNKEPRMPVINSEVCYEGICGSSYQDVQRILFWSCMLSGVCGHTYGANGIWQVNAPDQPYGPSPHGASWGSTPWNEACRLPGSHQVGLGKKLLERFRWWEFEPHPEWVEKHADAERPVAPFAAGVPGEVRVIFIPFLGGFGWGQLLIRHLEPDVTYRAYYFDPITGEEHDQGLARADENGCWRSGKFTKFQDWVLVLERTEV
jgi:hypothetical protein